MNKMQLYCLCCVFCLLAGCMGLPTNIAPLPTQTQAIPRLALEPCTVGATKAECGYLHVPEDRNHPNGRVLDLKIVIVRAYGPDRQPDPLFYIAGGPGQAIQAREDKAAQAMKLDKPSQALVNLTEEVFPGCGRSGRDGRLRHHSAPPLNTSLSGGSSA